MYWQGVSQWLGFNVMQGFNTCLRMVNNYIELLSWTDIKSSRYIQLKKPKESASLPELYRSMHLLSIVPDEVLNFERQCRFNLFNKTWKRWRNLNKQGKKYTFQLVWHSSQCTSWWRKTHQSCTTLALLDCPDINRNDIWLDSRPEVKGRKAKGERLTVKSQQARRQRPKHWK